MKITLFSSLFNHKDRCVATLDDLVELIKMPKGVIRETTIAIGATNGTQQQELKLTLPIFLATGVFTQRNDCSLERYSPYIAIDIDYKLPVQQQQRDQMWSALKKNPLTRLMYRSPRGGIKVIVEHDSCNPSHHAELYDQVAAGLGVAEADPSCKNLSRAHFICFDPNLHYNPKSQVFSFKPSSASGVIHTQPTLARSSRSALVQFSRFKQHFDYPKRRFKSDEAAIEEAEKWSSKHFPICKGFRNVNLFKLAALLHGWGIKMDDTLLHLTVRYVEHDFDGAEIERIVRSAYT